MDISQAINLQNYVGDKYSINFSLKISNEIAIFLIVEYSISEIKIYSSINSSLLAWNKGKIWEEFFIFPKGFNRRMKEESF